MSAVRKLGLSGQVNPVTRPMTHEPKASRMPQLIRSRSNSDAPATLSTQAAALWPPHHAFRAANLHSEIGWRATGRAALRRVAQGLAYHCAAAHHAYGPPAIL